MSNRMVRMLSIILSALTLLLVNAPIEATAFEGRFLAREDIILYGMGLKVEPAKQTVPKNIATIVSTYLQTPSMPDGAIPPLPPDATVKGTLRGPGLERPLDLAVQANTPFNIPPLVTPGTYVLDNIRLESGGQVLLRGDLESVTIEIIEKLLITQVTARPLTAAEIREKGIVFDKSNFQAYNFTAAFAVEPGKEIKLDMPVLLPTLAGAEDVTASTVNIGSLAQPQLQDVRTIIPDSLRLAQTKIPNLSVTGFSLKPVEFKGSTFVVPPIPGVVVIPGDIGFLNQYFSVMLMVGNVAPDGSNLVVKDLRAEILLPAGKDNVAGSGDDPLKMAMKDGGESPRIQAVVQPGPDGKLGTADDVASLAPGESGNAEYLVEGRREGSHTVEMEISGMLYGLPVGPVPVRGRAAGVVLVRNPTFTLTFTHPDIVNAGEEYSLDVTVTNTSESPANFVSINLHQQHLGGADLVDPTQSSKEIETILPGDSATVSFDLRSKVSGKVFAATLDSDEQIAGRFQLKSVVGELGIPLSPDSLVLPKEARSLPKSLRDAALGLLGKAYATATAPAAALPQDVIRFGKKIVWTRGIEVAQAGFRYSLHEPLQDTALHLLMDFMGSGYTRLSESFSKEDERKFEEDDFTGFDDLRRRSVRGDILAEAVAGLASGDFLTNGGSAFQADFSRKMSYRPSHLSVVLDGAGAIPPVTMSLVDPQGRIVGEIGAKGKITKAIPFSDYLIIKDAGQVRGEMAIVSVPAAGNYRIRLSRAADAQPGATFSLSVVAPGANGALQQLSFSGITVDDLPVVDLPAGSPQSFTVELVAGGTPVNGAPKAATARQAINDPPPSVIGVVQQADADVVANDCGIWRFGRIIAALFSEEVTSASVQDKLARSLITNYALADNAVVGVALQPDRRIAFIALRDPIGPFVPRSIIFDGISDRKGQTISGLEVPIEATITDPAAVVSGTVLQPDGNPLEGAEVRLFKQIEVLTENGCTPVWYGISDKFTKAGATYSWDYVLRGTNKIVAIDPPTEEFREISFTPARNGQRLNVNIVMLGRGILKGKVVGEDGATPLKDAKIRVTSLTDNSEYGYTTDATGTFVIPRIPVGNILVEAVHVPTNSRVVQSSYIGQSGSTVEMTLVLYTEAVRKVTVKYAAVEGHVLRYDGATPASGLPVYAFYQHNSQEGVLCPGDPPPSECAVAAATTDSAGKYAMPEVPAGDYRIYAFDQATYQEGTARMIVPQDQTAQLNILLSGGFGTIKGIVKDSFGTPVADAEVGGGMSLTKTDANGLFTLTDVPVGPRTIVAVSQLLGAKGQAVVDVSTPGVEYGATIVLEAQGGVFGTVVDALNNPVADLDVYLLGTCDDGLCGIASGKTNASGAYNFPNVPVSTSDYTVSAFRSDLSDGNVAKVSVRFAGQKVRADVAFKGRGRITGGIWNDNGNTPLAGKVSVSALRVLEAKSGSKMIGLGFEHTSHLKIIDTTIENNTFVFENVFVGPFVITAAGAFSPDPVTFAGELLTDGETKEVNMRLSATSVVTGVVYGPDGVTPVKNAVVNFKSDEFKTICTDNDPMAAVSQSGGTVTVDLDMLGSEQTCKAIPQGIQSLDARTDDNGRFTFPLVTAGKFTLSVEERDASDVPTGRTGKLSALVAAGDTADLSVRLFARAPLKVTVFTHNGTTRVANARVTVEQSTRIGAPKAYLTNGQGEVLFSGVDALDEGAFTVLAESNDGFAGRASGKIIADGTQVEVKVYLFDHTVTVSGVVYRPDGITPVRNAEVYIANAQGDLAFAVTNAAGEYSQDYIPLGDFRVNVFEAATGRRGFAAATAYLSTPVVTVNVSEMPIGLVKGTLYQGGELQPLAKWRVQLTQAYPSGRSLTLQATTGFDGKFSFPGVAAGAFTLTATGQGGSASASGNLTREAEIIDIPMVANLVKPQKGTVVGWVYRPDGTPAADTEVCLGDYCSPKTTSDSDGKFTFYDIGLGRFTVYASSQVNSERGVGYGDVPYAGGTGFVKVVMEGLGTISGTVMDGSAPAGGAAVILDKYPDAGCGASTCRTYADPTTGAFIFHNVPAGPFTVVANDPVNPQKNGSAGGTLNSGGSASVTVAYADTATLKLKVIFPDGTAAAGVIGALTRSDSFVLYRQTDASGIALFTAVPKGSYQLVLQDPAGLGLAKRSLQVVADQDLSAEPMILDEAPPEVKATLPMPGAIRVGLDTKVSVTFSEPVQPGSVDYTTITLTSADGTVDGFAQLQPGDTVALFTPLQPLKDERVYTIRVSGIKDRVDRPMTKDFIATFTTKDVTPPSFVSQYPGEGNISGIPLDSVVRVMYSEPFDPTRFAGEAITVTGPSGAVEGRLDTIFGNTGIVFTPKYPFAENSSYSVTILPATDLSGNSQSGQTSITFTTTDRTPPVVAGLAVSNSGLVVENGVATLTPTFSGGSDVSMVDWYVNGQPAQVVRTAPFTFSFQAIPAYGIPGSTIRVTAVATDTSGNRGIGYDAFVTVTPDAPPVAVNIITPVGGITAGNCSRVTVHVEATDDVGLARIAYQAVGGVGISDCQPTPGIPPATGSVDVNPPVPSSSKDFVFYVPKGATPGSQIVINATAIDSKGQATKAAPVAITVVDTIPPTVSFAGLSSGDLVKPGQQLTAVVAAADVGGVTSITFAANGTAFIDGRTISPAQQNAAATFTWTVPATFTSRDSVRLEARAVDSAGNSSDAPAIVLPVADTVPPKITIRTANDSSDMIPGQPLSIIVSAEDDTLIGSISVNGTGAFTFADGATVEPSGSVQKTFVVNVPADVAEGAVLAVSATATDVSANTSDPATLMLTAKTLQAVQLPASQLIAAGEPVVLTVTLAQPAPTEGLQIDLAGGPTLRLEPPLLTFAAGETGKTFSLTGLSGGSASVTAQINGATVATMPVTVRGGIVTGVVTNAQQAPVAGAQVVVNGVTTTTGDDGKFFVEGIAGPKVTVTAYDTVNKLQGYVTGQMNVANGYLRGLSIVATEAGSIKGTVNLASGVAAADGVKVEIFAQSDQLTPLFTTFTATDGTFEFPQVQLGVYTLMATDTSGNRGRSTVYLTTSGAEVAVTITFLGRGTINGVIRDANGDGASGLTVTLRNSHLFGSDTATTVSGTDGIFTFTGVTVGSFSLSATDSVSGYGASTSGSITSEGKVVNATLTLAAYGSIEGHVYRADGVTPAAGVTVKAGNTTLVTTDAGFYRFEVLPLAYHTITADDSTTRTKASVTVQLQNHQQELVRDVNLSGSGSIAATVLDNDGNSIIGANVSLTDGYGTISQTTDATGTAVFAHVYAGNFTLNASKTPLHGSTSGTVSDGGQLPVTITILADPAATVSGIVYAPDGATPAGGVTVTLSTIACRTSWYSCRSVSLTTDGDGGFTFTGQKLETYDLSVRDTNNVLRAKARDIVLNSDGQVEQRTLTMVGLGVVNGRVFMPNSSTGAPNMPVTVRSLNPDFGTTTTVRTNAAGYYQVERIAVGAVAVTAGDTAQMLLGETSGTVAADGVTVTLDVSLLSNAVTMPQTLRDGNLSSFDIQGNGAIRYGASNLFYVTNNTNDLGGAALYVTSSDTTTVFPNLTAGTKEMSDRQYILKPTTTIHGLTVTRKVYVPQEGYFARYVEVLENTSADVKTVSVQVKTTFNNSYYQNCYWYSCYGYQPYYNFLIDSTSSGDNQLLTGQEGDRWAVIDNTSNYSYSTPIGTKAAAVWGSDNAQAYPSVAALTPWSSYDFSGAALKTAWDITIQPGERVAFMHFLVQETSVAGARAAAQRLSQLPPEALTGLGQDDLLAIRNFFVPVDGSSSLTALPRLTGTVTVNMKDGTGAPLLSQVDVTLQSNNAIFGKTFTTQNRTCTYDWWYGTICTPSTQATFTSNLHTESPTMGIPLGPFTVASTRTAGGVTVSATATGDFAAGASTASVDLQFVNSGNAAGVAKFNNGSVVTNGTLRVLNGTDQVQSISLSGSGAFTFQLLPSGTFTLELCVPSSMGGSQSCTNRQITVTAGQTAAADITLPPLGMVRGKIFTWDGNPLVSHYLYLNGTGSTGSFSRSAYTDTSGSFTFTEIPPGTYELSSYDPNSSLQRKIPVVMADGQEIVQDLRFQKSGAITVAVTYADGTAYGNNVNLTVTEIPGGASLYNYSYFYNGNNTSVFGSDAGNLKVSASISYYQGSNRTATGESTIPGFTTSGGPYLQAAVKLPVNMSNVTLRALSTSGTPVTGEQLEVRLVDPADGTTWSSCWTSSSTGSCTIYSVYAGDAGLRAQIFISGAVVAEATGQMTASNGTTTLDIQMPYDPVQFPKYMYDGNGSKYDIGKDGALEDGENYVFEQYYSGRAAMVLTLTPQQGSAVRFDGPTANSGISEDSGREVVTKQDGLAGFNVTRKIYVPKDGYFARYLDIVTNPGTEDITVDVSMAMSLNASSSSDYNKFAIRASSDPAIADTQPTDRSLAGTTWALAADSQLTKLAALVWTDDPARGPTSASFSQWVSSYSSPAKIANTFHMTVPAGKSVALLHFLVQQSTQDAAVASAQRLVQLPPEAMAGMSPEERHMVINFAVPEDGVGTMSPLPLMDGQVIGYVKDDNGNPLPAADSDATVYLVSSLPYFPRKMGVYTDDNARFTFMPRTDESSNRRVIPRAPFTLQATMSRYAFQATSPVVGGSFGSGDSMAVQDVVFSSTGRITATVTLSDGTPVTGSTVYARVATCPTCDRTPYFTEASGGTYREGFFMPGDYRVYSELAVPLAPSSGGSRLIISAPVTVVAGQENAVTVAAPPLGSIGGTVKDLAGNAVASTYVTVRSTTNSSFSRYLYTYSGTNGGASGTFVFQQLPADTYVVEINDKSGNGVKYRYNITLAAGEVLSRDFSYTLYGRVTGKVSFKTSGYYPTYVTVRMIDPATGQEVTSASTGSSDTFTFSRFAMPTAAGAQYEARISFSYYNYSESKLVTASKVVPNVTANDQLIDIGTLSLPVDRGNVTVNLQNSSGAAFNKGVSVEIREPDGTVLKSTSFTGSYTFSDIYSGQPVLTVRATYAGATYEAPVTLVPNGTAQATIQIPVFDATLSGTLYAGDGTTPLTYANYSIVRADGTKAPCNSYYSYYYGWQYYYSCSTSGDGSFTTTAFPVRDGEPLKIAASRSDIETVEYPFTYPAGTTSLTITPRLPVFVVRGNVQRADSSAVSGGSVTIVVTDPVTPDSYYTSGGYILGDGSFAVFGTRTGNFTLTAQTALGVSGAVTGQVADLMVPVSGLVVTLDPAGTVTGTVTRGGTAVANTEVIVTVTEYGMSQSYWTNSAGEFSAVDVPFAAFTATATTSFGSGTIYSDTASGTLTADNPAAQVHLVFTLNPGSVYGTVRDIHGYQVADRSVYITRVSDGYSYYAYTDGSGYYEVPELSPGAYLADSSEWYDDGYVVGTATGTLAEGGTLLLDINLKPGTYLGWAEFDRPDAWSVYSIARGGGIRSWWDTAGLYNSPYYYFHTLYDNVADYDYYTRYAAIDDVGQFETVPVVIGGKIYSRKIYTPPDSGFLRYVEIIQNPGTADVTVAPYVDGYLEYPNNGSWSYVIDPVAGANSYVVQQAASDQYMPQVAMVMQGVNSPETPLPVTVVTSDATVDNAHWSWPVTVPAGSTACIMHYVITTPPSDTNIEAKAKALRDLTDPYALTGLSAADRACIKNFIVPQE